MFVCACVCVCACTSSTIGRQNRTLKCLVEETKRRYRVVWPTWSLQIPLLDAEPTLLPTPYKLLATIIIAARLRQTVARSWTPGWRETGRISPCAGNTLRQTGVYRRLHSSAMRLVVTPKSRFRRTAVAVSSKSTNSSPLFALYRPERTNVPFAEYRNRSGRLSRAPWIPCELRLHANKNIIASCTNSYDRDTETRAKN